MAQAQGTFWAWLPSARTFLVGTFFLTSEELSQEWEAHGVFGGEEGVEALAGGTLSHFKEEKQLPEKKK